MRSFSWVSDSREGILTIVLKGELDLAAASEAGSRLQGAVVGAERIIVLDLGQLSFMDSSGLRLLVDMRQSVEKSGGRLLLGRLSNPVKRLFDVAGVSQWFEYLEGEAPEYTSCPVCEGELQSDATRCPRCGSVF